MIIGVTGDWHLDNQKPDKRLDRDWQKTQEDKVRTLLEYCHLNDARVLLQPGDFTNRHTLNYDTVRNWILNLNQWKKQCGVDRLLTIYGQHDLRYHSSNVDNTPLAVLEAGSAVEIVHNRVVDIEQVAITGVSWGAEIPPITNPEMFNILMIHKMVIKNEKVWEGQDEFVTGLQLLKETKYNLIVSGDNHKQFTVKGENGRMVINAGALFRTSINTSDHRPCVFFYDTAQHKLVNQCPIPALAFTEVFDMTKAEKDEKVNKELEAFVEQIRGGEVEEGVNFRENIAVALKGIQDQRVVKFIEGVLA